MVLGICWIFSQRLAWNWVASVMLGLFAGAAAVGAWLDLQPGLVAFGLLAALSAWNLEQLLRELQRADKVMRERELKQRHLWRLVIADGLGLLLVVGVLAIQIRFSFGLAIILALVALLGLSRSISFLRRESD